jgi:adenylate kinase family enzyme
MRSPVKRVTILASASGSGKTTFARRLALALDVPHVELDAIHHQPDWRELDADEFRRRVAPIVARTGWVIDGVYRGKLGDLTLERADLVIWLDLPRRVWLPRLVLRTLTRVALRQELWNGNRESLRSVLLSRDSLVLFALRNDRRRQHVYPRALAAYRVARLRSPREVEAFLRSVRERSSAIQASPRSPSQSGVSTT